MKKFNFIYIFIWVMVILDAGLCLILNRSISEDDRCPEFPISSCIKYNQCMKLHGYEELPDSIEGCGFSAPYAEELVCCPVVIDDSSSSSTVVQSTTTVTSTLN